ncbi:MAG: Y-family DNA polymerase [Pseudomonadales bacterium]
MLWLGVHFPLLPLEVFTAGRACADPQVVIHDSRVVLRNTAAIEAGIGLGSTLATAHSIAAGVRHYRRNPERELERLSLLAEVLYGFSARVSLMPMAAGVVLEIGGSLKLFGDVDQLAQRARALCHELGHEVRIRWAATPLAALTLARADTSSLGQVPLDQAAIEPKQLTPERIERFANMGIRTLEQLLALPSRGLAQRFGKDLLDYLARLTGERPDPRPSISPPERFHATLHLLEPLDSKEALIFPMQRLLIDLQHWLVARQLGAEQLRWYFSASGSSVAASDAGDRADVAPERQSRVCMPVRFARAQQRREAFLEITRLQMADMVLPEEVIGLELEAPRLIPWAAGDRGLFHNQPGMHSPADEMQGLDELVDQLRARLGRGACYSLEVQEQHLPERAWAGVTPQLAAPRPPPRHRRKKASAPAPAATAKSPAATAKSPAATAKSPAQSHGKAGKRPLWLFEPPRAIGLQQLTLLRGPERIHTGWWLTGGETATPSEHPQGVQTPPSEIRDYYVARHHSGAECWVFVDPQERWFLHGYFA